jgi:Tfp pilus assembly pilus retraction ATPase PilT
MDHDQKASREWMNKERKKRAFYLENAKPGPISDEYRFSNTGLYLVIGGMGSGKSHFISDHILTTD